MAQKSELLKQLNKAIRNYRMAVRWYRDTISYKNCVSEAWSAGNRFEDLKEDAELAHKEAIADIFRWRKRISATTKELMRIADEERKKNEG